VTTVGDRDFERIQEALGALLRLHASRRVFAERAAAAGVAISQPGFDLLGRVDDEGALTLGALGRLTHMDPSAVGRQVRQLEEQGLLVRSADPEDRRVTRVRATPRGHAARRAMADAGRRHFATALADWSPADRAALARVLPQLVDDLRAHRYPNLVEQESA
jgi:DNA-binding MarR family transcriptional regulator